MYIHMYQVSRKRCKYWGLCAKKRVVRAVAMHVLTVVSVWDQTFPQQQLRDVILVLHSQM